jgi:hypothetical protein
MTDNHLKGPTGYAVERVRDYLGRGFDPGAYIISDGFKVQRVRTREAQYNVGNPSSVSLGIFRLWYAGIQ